jgi:hypothetical protein
VDEFIVAGDDVLRRRHSLVDENGSRGEPLVFQSLTVADGRIADIQGLPAERARAEGCTRHVTRRIAGRASPTSRSRSRHKPTVEQETRVAVRASW